METPTTLLNAAMHESEGPERTTKVIKACKMITDILPFDKRNYVLLEDSELMKSLMISLPLNHRSIDMIILSMIQKFQSSHHFLKEMWLGFTFIANLDESDWNVSRKYEGSFKNHYSATRKQYTAQSRDIDDSFGSNTGGRPISYCPEIERSKQTIKLYVLKYVEMIVDLLIHAKVRLTVPFKPDIPFLLKTFLIFTNNEKAIIKTCTILETVRQADPKSTIDHEIEEIIVNKTKRTSFLASSTQENVSYVIESGTLKSPTAASTIQKRRLERADSGNSASLGASPLMKLGSNDRLQVIEEATAIETSNHMSSNHYGSMDYHEEDSFEIDNIGGKVNEEDIITLDKWLCDWEIDEVPLLTRGEHIQDIIQRRENFEALLSFVIDPRLYAVSEIWRRKHKVAMDEYDGEDMGSRTPKVDSPTHLNQFDRLKENRTFHPYMIRSFKALQVLCDLRNFKYLMQIQKEGLEIFYTNFYVTCIAKEKNLCNFNHLAKLTEFLVRKEFHESTRFLIQFNLIFKFLQNISFQYVQHLFLTLFGCSEYIKEQDPGAISKVLEYCKISQFFLDLATAILLGPETLDGKKYDIEYKPAGVGPLLRATTDGSVFFFSVDERPLAYEMEVQETCFPEETKGFVVDIDYLQPVLKAKKNVDFKKLKSMKTRIIPDDEDEDGNKSPKRSVPKVSSKSMSTKRYPSLVEKDFYPKAVPLREIKLNSKQRLDDHGETSDIRLLSNQTPKTGLHKRNSKSVSNAIELLHSKPTTPVVKNTRLNLVPEGKSLAEAINPDALKNALLTKGNMKKPIGSVPQTPKTPNDSQAAAFFKGSGQPIKLVPIVPNTVKGSLPGSEQKKILLPQIETAADARNQMTPTAPVTMRANSLQKKPSLGDGASTPSHLWDLKAKSTSKLDFRIQSRTRLDLGSQTDINGDVRGGPRPVTVARELRTDSIDKNNLLLLNQLYPLSRKDIVLADLDFEAKKPAFSIYGIKANEHYSLSGCEMLEEMFRRAFLLPQKKNETERNRDEGEEKEEEEQRKMKKYQDTKEIGLGEVDHTEFWTTVFSENYQVFELLFKNYLLKIKMNATGENNSGYVSGRIINMLLEKWY